MNEMNRTDKREWQISTGSADELNTAMKQVLELYYWNGRSGGVDAGRKLMDTLIEVGATSAANGMLDLRYSHAFSVLLQHPEALNKVARKIYHDEELEVFE